jgi:hypothetical protein
LNGETSRPDIKAGSYMDMDRGLKRRCSLHREGYTESGLGRVKSGMLNRVCGKDSLSYSKEGSSYIPLVRYLLIPGRHQWTKGGLDSEALSSGDSKRQAWMNYDFRSVIVITISRYGLVQMSSTKQDDDMSHSNINIWFQSMSDTALEPLHSDKHR